MKRRTAISSRFQTSVTANPAVSAIGAPRLSMVTLMSTNPSTMPTSPPSVCANSAAAAGPPMRGCSMTMRLDMMTGSTDRTPVSCGGTYFEIVMTPPAATATMSARTGRSIHRRSARLTAIPRV